MILQNIHLGLYSNTAFKTLQNSIKKYPWRREAVFTKAKVIATNPSLLAKDVTGEIIFKLDEVKDFFAYYNSFKTLNKKNFAKVVYDSLYNDYNSDFLVDFFNGFSKEDLVKKYGFQKYNEVVGKADDVETISKRVDFERMKNALEEELNQKIAEKRILQETEYNKLCEERGKEEEKLHLEYEAKREEIKKQFDDMEA